MSENRYHIAELNIARMIAPLDSPVMAEFINNLNALNSLGEQSEGFVWRLKTDDGSATSIRAFDDPAIIVNLTVWASIEALFEFTYKSEHVDFFRRRREWFEKLESAAVVLWWIPAGTPPTVEEAKAKLEYLQANGPTPLAFTFKQRFTVEEMLALA